MKKLPVLFAIMVFLITTVTTPTIVSALASSSTTNSSNDTASSPLISSQKEKDNTASAFKITDQIKALINELVDKNKTNAAIAIGFIDPNGTQFYGHGKLSNTSNATVDQNTIFAIGSNTKVFTTILLADMVNKGLIKLDDPIEKYLPSNVTVPQYKGHKITIEDLATHTSGLPEWPSNYCPIYNPLKGQPQLPDTVQNRINELNCYKPYTLDQMYKGLSNTTLLSEPGSKAFYSTFGIGLLGHILTLKSNMSSYDELLKHNILDVLGMNDTTVGPPSDSQKSHLAIGHFNGQELPPWNLTVFSPGGAIYSTVSDMLKFLSANMGLIKTKLDSAMQESHLIRHSSDLVLPNNLQVANNTKDAIYFGLGWFISTNFGHEIIWHNGATVSGYNAFMAFNPVTERGIVILCSAAKENIIINNISFDQRGKLASLLWNLLNPIDNSSNSNNIGSSIGGKATSGNVGHGGSCYALIIGDNCGGSTGSTEPRGGAAAAGNGNSTGIGGDATSGDVGNGGSCFALIIGNGCGGSTGSTEPRGGAATGSNDENSTMDTFNQNDTIHGNIRN